ncbi:MAG: UbiA prenyltransferase family protein, partial [Clostridiales bacterium]|nr:UbiA prenyltransferase family protein [Clostridiales bacterium]
MRLIINSLKVMRIKQYVKNSFIFIPFFFSLKFTEPYYWGKSLLAFLAFCALSSGVYIFNDILDRKKDALHPEKKKRVIASGEMKVPAAAALTGILLTAFCALSLCLNLACFLTGIIYLLINIAYSLYLKKIPIFDVLCIALGFMLRVIMGGYAIESPISHLLLLTIISLSFFLGFGKRRNEQLALGPECGTRDVLDKYTVSFLDHAMTSLMSVAIVLYAFWAIDPQITAKFGEQLIYTTIPVILILLRYSYILRSPASNG